MVAKHANLATDKLILVAEAGFTAQARSAADAAGAVAISPEASHKARHYAIVNQQTGMVEVSLTHRRLGDVSYAFGKSVIDDRPVSVVITESEPGAVMTLRFRQD